jgi:hypothetical protein
MKRNTEIPAPAFRSLYLTLLGACFLFGGGCAHYLNNYHLDGFRKNMPRCQVLAFIGFDPAANFAVAPSDGPLTVDVFQHVNGNYVSDYFLLYENDNLLYWGYPHEYAKHSDPKIQKAGRSAVIHWNEIKKGKKT